MVFMRQFKRFTAALAAASLCLSAAACGTGNTDAPEEGGSGISVQDPASGTVYDPPKLSADVADDGTVTLVWEGDGSLCYEVSYTDSVTGKRTVCASAEPGDPHSLTLPSETEDFSRIYTVTPFESWEDRLDSHPAAPAAELHLRSGLLLEEGRLRCYRDNETLKSTWENGLYFDRKGCYTCGNKELDEHITSLITRLSTPEMTRLQVFDALYHHIANEENYYYEAVRFISFGTEDWEVDSALAFFEKGYGNCFSFSAATMLCARAVGLESSTVIGSCYQLYEWVDHCWTEVVLDGTTYLCDAEMEGIYAPNHLVEWDLFMKEYDTTPTIYQIWEAAP